MDDIFKSSLLALYPDYHSVLGPYVMLQNDGRWLVVLYGGPPKTVKRSLSWPKAVMEVRLGRHLTTNELVDHIDDDPTNNDPDNFQILTVAENTKKGRVARGIEEKIDKFFCPECGCEFERLRRRVRHNQNSQQKAGPFCGKSCAGRYSARVQATYERPCGRLKRA